MRKTMLALCFAAVLAACSQPVPTGVDRAPTRPGFSDQKQTGPRAATMETQTPTTPPDTTSMGNGGENRGGGLFGAGG